MLHTVYERLEKLLASVGLDDVVFRVLVERMFSVKHVVELLKAPLGILQVVADEITRSITGRRVGYIRNMILNYTNVCVVQCRFCSFHAKPGDKRAYVMKPEEAARLVRMVWEQTGIRQVLVQGGVNPSLRLDYYKRLFRLIKEETKGRVAIHGLSAPEVLWLSRLEGERVETILEELREAGLDTLPGGGAEILSDRVRSILSPLKGSVAEFLRVHEAAMKLGIPVSATMVYGHIETLEEVAEHLLLILNLQRRGGLVLAFIPWNYEPGGVLRDKLPWATGGEEHLRILAVARIVFADEIRFIQSGWLTMGRRLAQAALHFGANDWGGTLYNEKVLPATGLKVSFPTPREIEEWIRQAGREPYERDHLYRPVA